MEEEALANLKRGVLMNPKHPFYTWISMKHPLAFSNHSYHIEFPFVSWQQRLSSLLLCGWERARCQSSICCRKVPSVGTTVAHMNWTIYHKNAILLTFASKHIMWTKCREKKRIWRKTNKINLQRRYNNSKN